VVTKKVTKKQIDNWQKNELSWFAKKQLSLVAIMSIVQITMLALMLLFMYINSVLF
tara:strand:+ start:829 stop:996 length:168 start_codon:yes stop_codon:yes gene_type:complete